ncbi:MAG: hypothetical protein IEMM0008_0781 [bacterium]|nr:MAG: hypothetical protein IEMM0008_0781 [bacterium]
MGIVETSTSMNQVQIHSQVQVSVLRKAMETRQNLAMDLIEKNAQIANQIQQRSIQSNHFIDVRV